LGLEGRMRKKRPIANRPQDAILPHNKREEVSGLVV